MDKIHTITDIVVKVLCGAWIIYMFGACRKTLKVLDDIEYDD